MTESSSDPLTGISENSTVTVPQGGLWNLTGALNVQGRIRVSRNARIVSNFTRIAFGATLESSPGAVVRAAVFDVVNASFVHVVDSAPTNQTQISTVFAQYFQTSS